MKGPYEHMMSMLTADRMFFTTVYFGSMFLTLYLTFTKGGIKGYALVIISSGIQLVALLWYLISFLLGGTMGPKNLVLQAICSMLKPLLSVCLRLQTMCISACVGFWRQS